MQYPDCLGCKCNTCLDDYCKIESCAEGCRNDIPCPVTADCHGRE